MTPPRESTSSAFVLQLFPDLATAHPAAYLYLKALAEASPVRRGPRQGKRFWPSPERFVAFMKLTRRTLEDHGLPFTEPQVAHWLNRYSNIDGLPRTHVTPTVLLRWVKSETGLPSWASLIDYLDALDTGK